MNVNCQQMSLSNLSIRVAQTRRKFGFSQKKFAARVGITNKELQKIEHGDIEPSLDLVLCMAEILGCDVGDLYKRKRKGPIVKPGRYLDLSGKRFGSLVAIEPTSIGEGISGRKNMWWICRCDCGNAVTVRGDVLRAGKKTNCGCCVDDKKPNAKYFECPDALGRELVLPNGVEHGSIEAIRIGCTCEKCLARKKKITKRVV